MCNWTFPDGPPQSSHCAQAGAFSIGPQAQAAAASRGLLVASGENERRLRPRRGSSFPVAPFGPVAS